MGLASSRSHARQIVSHGHITLNGRKTNVPSALVNAGDRVAIRPESTRRPYFRELRQDYDNRQVPRWLAVNPEALSAEVIDLPKREDIDVTLNEQLIVEYYSR
jgi:small subunit ribosomal protein S4